MLQSELYDDVDTQSRASSRPWRPVVPGSSASPYAPTDATADMALFSVVRLADGELVGSATLWGIDPHNRLAHLGISLRPAHRGRGLAVDIVRVLCRYGFSTLGLRRLQAETLADNTAMIRAALRVGFIQEGTLRCSAWVSGQFVDEVILGLLDTEWALPRTATAS